MCPAARVVLIFGEVRAAEIAGLGVDALRKWKRRKATGGKGGLVPDEHQAKFLEVAAAEGLPLLAHDLIGRPY